MNFVKKKFCKFFPAFIVMYVFFPPLAFNVINYMACLPQIKYI